MVSRHSGYQADGLSTTFNTKLPRSPWKVRRKNKQHDGAQFRVFQFFHSHVIKYLYAYFVRENLVTSYTDLQRRLGNRAVCTRYKWDLIVHILCHHKEKNKRVRLQISLKIFPLSHEAAAKLRWIMKM